MPTIHLSLREDVSAKTRTAGQSFKDFVVTMNQGLELIQRVGGQAFRALDEVFTAAGRSEQLRTGFVSLSGSVEKADANLLAVQGALRGTVSEMEAMEIANMALSFGIVETDEQLGELTEIGAVLAQSLGMDATKGVSDLTLALSRQSPMILDNLGISLKLTDAYDMYAESLGITAAQLSDTQKRQAFLNSALEIGREKVQELGGFVESNATDWQRMKAALADSRENLMRLLSSGDGLADWLAEMGENVRGLSEALPGVAATASEVGSILKGLGATVGELADEVVSSEVALELLGTQFELQPGHLEQAIDGYREMAKGSAALEEAQTREAALIAEINKALQANYTTREEAYAALAEWRILVAKNREDTHAAGRALQEYNEELAEQERAQEEATAALEAERKAMERLGLSTDDTTEGKEQLAKEGKAAYELLAKSGKFSAEVLERAWRESLEGTARAFDATSIDIIGTNTELVHDLAEAFGPGMFSEDDSAFATWLDRERNELLERQEELMGPISDGVSEGIEQGFDDADFSGFGKDVRESVRRSLIDVMYDKELVAAIGAAFGLDVQRQEIADLDNIAGFGGVEDLGSRDQRKVQQLLRNTNGAVAQALQGVLNALEAGDVAFLANSLGGALDNIDMINRYGLKNRQNREARDTQGAIVDGIRELLEIFGVKLPGFARGGIADFGPESLVRLHGREAVIPLDRGGSELRSSIMGGDIMPILHALVEETRMQTVVVETALGEVAVNTRVSAEAVDEGRDVLKRYERDRRERALMVARDPLLLGG